MKAKNLLRIFIGFVFVFPIVNFLIPQLDFMFWLSFSLVIVGYFLVYFIHRKKKSDSIMQDDSNTNNHIPKEILSLIFAVIAGFAITRALSHFSDSVGDGLLSLGIIMRLISFFAISIPFFHASLSILKTNTKLNKHPSLIFLMFIVLFVNAVIIYLQAENLLSPNLFVTFITILVGFNAVWLLLQKPLVTFYKIKETKNGGLPHEEWMEMHSITFSYLFFSFLPYIQQSSVHLELLDVVLFFVLVARVTFDYIVGWNSVYSTTIPGVGDGTSGGKPAVKNNNKIT